MRTPSILLRAAACAALALAAAACESNGDGGGGGPAGSADVEGALRADGVVRIAKIDRSTVNQDGKVRYWIDNVSGQDQEDLQWSVSFVFPLSASSAISMEGGIALSAEEETTAERTLVLLRGETGKLLEAQCGAFADRHARGLEVIGTRLNVAPNPPVLTLARQADGSPGTKFLGKIECVGQSSVWEGEELVLEFENVSPAKVSNLELQVVFVDTRAKSRWKAIPTMAPGQRGKVVVDLRGLDMGSRDFLVKVRQQAL